MLLTIDVGNTNIKFGTFDGDALTKFSIPTGDVSSVDDLRTAVVGRIDPRVCDVIVCSVVPAVDPLITQFAETAFGCQAVLITNKTDLGLKVRYQPLSSVGTDRLVNVFAAVEQFEFPFIVCSLGTATTFDVVNDDRVVLGGVIAPGINAMSRALHLSTAKLPDVEIEKPSQVISVDTQGAIRSGIFYGYIAMVEGIISRLRDEAEDDLVVIATGGAAPFIAKSTSVLGIVDEDLLLDGLRLIHERDHPA
ncbi:MAG: type III pantothenate kinase [Pyrinomonadaceae bacterium]